jgi:hypothetical protein
MSNSDVDGDAARAAACWAIAGGGEVARRIAAITIA